MPDGRWVNTPIGPIFVPHGWRLSISKPWIQNIKGHDPRKAISYRVRMFQPMEHPRKWRAKHRHRHAHAVGKVGARYRERDLTQGLFLHGRRDPSIKASTVLGKLFLFENGKRTINPNISPNITAGSDLSPSLHMVKTWDFVHQGPPYREGGPFNSVQYHLPASELVGHGSYTNRSSPGQPAGTYSEYNGAFVDNGVWSGESYSTISSKSLSSFPSLSAYHTAAWDKLKPQIPKASLAQFIYELKDLPGQLKTTAELFHLRWADLTRSSSSRGTFVPYMSPREAADQFLNEEFGWKPFLSDIQKLFDVFTNTGEYISRLTRDNGIFVRRRRVLEESDITLPDSQIGVDSATIPSSGMIGPNGLALCKVMSVPGGGTQKGFSIISTRNINTVWAVGSFKYYRPEFDSTLFDGNSFDLLNSAQRLMTLYGLRITPTLLYKIYPWTWAVDWFTGLGKFIERYDDFIQDGIVAQYLYVCNTIKKVMTKSSILNFYDGPLTLNFVRQYTLKSREFADSPYGFDVPWNSISPRQWAILGAIGITRSSTGYITRGA